MIEVFDFVFKSIGSVFNVMDTFIIYENISLLVFFLGFNVIFIILLLFRFGFHSSINSLTNKLTFTNRENIKDKESQKYVYRVRTDDNNNVVGVKREEKARWI